MKYEVRMNGNYMNCYATYTKAATVRDYLEQRYKGAKVEIIERKRVD